MSQSEQGSEYRQFVETLRRLGVEYSLDYAPTKKVWQRPLLTCGFNITAHSCIAVVVGDTEYLFSTGYAYYLDLGKNEDARGIGPTGVFLMQRSVKAGKVTPRKYFESEDGAFVGSGYSALAVAYPIDFIGARV